MKNYTRSNQLSSSNCVLCGFHGHVGFNITLPLIGHDKFSLYNIIPCCINSTIIIIETCSPVLVITTIKYTLVSSSQRKTCDVVSREVFIVYGLQLQCSLGAENVRMTLTCLMRSHIKLISLNASNLILTHKNRCVCVMNCAIFVKEIIPMYLGSSGLLTINPDCILKHHFIFA